jgi:type IV fimbrial biogenesis protein FimT
VSSRRAGAGFTLIELMVVVSLIAVISTIAAPNLSSMIATMNAKSASFDLVGDLAMARSESLKRNTTVSVVPVNGSWTNGWRVTTPAEATPLRERGALPSRISLSAPNAGVVFQANGRLSDDDQGTSWSITSTQSGVTPRCVVITPTGTARAKRGDCA